MFWRGAKGSFVFSVSIDKTDSGLSGSKYTWLIVTRDRLSDIIIYPDRINLYCFPNMTDWGSFAAFYTQKYGDYEKRTAATEQAAWKAFRDKYLRKSYKVKSGTYESPNSDKNSSKRLKAYKKIFKAIKQKKLYKKTFLKHFSTQELGVAWPAFPFL